MTDLSPEERDLIALARQGEDPSDAARARMRANIMGRIGVGAAAAGATVASTTAVAKAAAASPATIPLWAKLFSGALVVGAVGGGGYVAVERSPAEAPIVATTMGTTVTAIGDQAMPAAGDGHVATEAIPDERPGDEPEADPKETRPSVAAPIKIPSAVASARTKPGPKGIKSELDMLRGAQQRLQGGDPSNALAMLDAHEKSHPDGSLKQERMAVRVFALCQMGKRAEARAAAARFLATAPDSPLAPRVRRACAGPADQQ